jgi:hypothetical protein
LKFGYKAPEDQNYKIILQDTVFAQPRVYVDGLPPKSLSQYYTKKEADTIFVSKNAIPDNITVLGNDVNIPGGLVQIDSKGKIPSELYDSGASYTVGQGIAITDDNQISFNPSSYTEPFSLTVGDDPLSRRAWLEVNGNTGYLNMGFHYKQSNDYIYEGRLGMYTNEVSLSYGANSLALSDNILKFNNYILAPRGAVYWIQDVWSNYTADFQYDVVNMIRLNYMPCTLTLSVPYNAPYTTMLLLVDNSYGGGGSLLFGEEELITSNETGKYALFFMNFYSNENGADNIKCYNKVEI